MDSFSHAHAGEGGLLDWQEEILSGRVERAMARDGERRKEYELRDAYHQLAWIAPKMAHKRMIERLMQLHVHLILCLRAEEKQELVKDPKTQKLEFKPKETLAGYKGWIPICEKTLPYVLTASFVLTPDKSGVLQPIKVQEQHKALFPLDVPVGEDSGRRIAEWVSGGAEPTTHTPSVKPAAVSTAGPTDLFTTVAEKVAAERKRLGYPDEQFDSIVAKRLNGPLEGAPDELIEKDLLPWLRRLSPSRGEANP